jgi:hypothetical protein
MPDEQTTPDPAEHAHEGTVLNLLILSENQRPWSMHEIALEIGSPTFAADAIANLHATGLVHKTSDGFIFATRAALAANELAF